MTGIVLFLSLMIKFFIELGTKQSSRYGYSLMSFSQLSCLQFLFNEAIAVNSTAYEDNDPMTGQSIFVGDKTEVALLRFAKELNWRSAREMRNAADVVQNIPLSDREVMGVVIKRPDGGYRAYFRGPSETLARASTKHIVVREERNSSQGIEVQDIDELPRENINRTTIFYRNEMLHTIALAY